MTYGIIQTMQRSIKYVRDIPSSSSSSLSPRSDGGMGEQACISAVHPAGSALLSALERHARAACPYRYVTYVICINMFLKNKNTMQTSEVNILRKEKVRE